MLLSVEPLESLRYFDYLSANGILVTSKSPFVNIPNYPELEKIMEKIETVEMRVVVDSEKLAKEAGFSRAQNIVMLGAASPFLILEEESLKEYIRVLFQSRGDKVVDINLKAFALGREIARKAESGRRGK